MNIKFILCSFFIFIISTSLVKSAQIEITTSSGVEVFKKEKYYLLKEDVDIVSENFNLQADHVKAYFDKDLYDIVQIDSKGNVNFNSNRGVIGKGDIINLNIKNEDIYIEGKNSSLINKEINMESDGKIKVNNSSGDFEINGLNSKLKSETIDISGKIIKGRFLNVNGVNEVQDLFVVDDKLLNIKTENLNMFSIEANYNKSENIIELFDNVKIIRDNESVTGDYAKINTLNESYKVTSKDSKKVKILLNESTE